MTLDNATNCLTKLIEIIQENNAFIQHVESRRSAKNKEQFDIFLEMRCNTIEYSKILSTLRNTPKSFSEVNLVKNGSLDSSNKKENENLWIPFSIWDLDFCNHLTIKYEPDIDSRHPGFSDMEYRKRRSEIADVAFQYKQLGN